MKKTSVNNFFYSFSGRIASKIVVVIASIILARLLTPEDFGKVAIITVFISISNSLVDSGFTIGLIREKNVTSKDKSTVFYINLIISFVLYSILYAYSGHIAVYFRDNTLNFLTKILGVEVILKAITVVPRAMLMHDQKFKELGVIDITSTFVMNAMAIMLAYFGATSIALVMRNIVGVFLTVVLLYRYYKWTPKLVEISKISFKKYFPFSSKILLSSMIDTGFSNISNVLIARNFPIALLGLYNRANFLTNQLVTIILTSLNQVTFPILRDLSEENSKFTFKFLQINELLSFIYVPIGFMLVLFPELIVAVLFGDKWIDTADYLRILGVVVFIYSPVRVNLNALNIYGLSKVVLWFNFISKSLLMFCMLVGMRYGITGLIWSVVSHRTLEYLVILYVNDKLLSIPYLTQFSHLLRYILLYGPGLFILLTLDNIYSSVIYQFILLCIVTFLYFSLCILFKSRAITTLKRLIIT